MDSKNGGKEKWKKMTQSHVYTCGWRTGSADTVRTDTPSAPLKKKGGSADVNAPGTWRTERPSGHGQSAQKSAK